MSDQEGAVDTQWMDDGAQLVCTLTEQGQTLGYIVIDSTIGGRAMGGLRMLPDVSLSELQWAARAMTLKYGFLGLPQGGAKAGLRFDPEAPAEERQQALAAFARLAEPLLRRGVYTPNSDMGTDADDIAFLLRCAGVRPRRKEAQRSDSGYYTAQSVMACAQVAAQFLGLSLRGARVAVEGLGHVGGALALLLHEAGARVVAASTSQGAVYHEAGLDVPTLMRSVRARGSGGIADYRPAQHISPNELFQLPVDLICPCARLHSIRRDNAESIQARLVCPGANNPMTPQAETILHQRGILSVPDFVANAGGVLGGTMEFASCRRPQISAFIRQQIGRRLEEILQQAEQEGVSPRQVAEARALARRKEVVAACARRTFGGALFLWGLTIYRRGWLPGWAVARLTPAYLARTMVPRSAP